MFHENIFFVGFFVGVLGCQQKAAGTRMRGHAKLVQMLSKTQKESHCQKEIVGNVGNVGARFKFILKRDSAAMR